MHLFLEMTSITHSFAAVVFSEFIPLPRSLGSQVLCEIYGNEPTLLPTVIIFNRASSYNFAIICGVSHMHL